VEEEVDEERGEKRRRRKREEEEKKGEEEEEEEEEGLQRRGPPVALMASWPCQLWLHAAPWRGSSVSPLGRRGACRRQAEGNRTGFMTTSAMSHESKPTVIFPPSFFVCVRNEATLCCSKKILKRANPHVAPVRGSSEGQGHPSTFNTWVQYKA